MWHPELRLYYFHEMRKYERIISQEGDIEEVYDLNIHIIDRPVSMKLTIDSVSTNFVGHKSNFFISQLVLVP